MIRVKLYQNKNEKNETVYNKWYPRVIVEETSAWRSCQLTWQATTLHLSKGAINGFKFVEFTLKQ